MTRAIALHTDHAQIDQTLGWLLHLPQLPQDDLPPVEQVREVVEKITEPARPDWCMARVASLLSPYFDKDTPQAVREMEAEDWAEALSEFPQWAIDRAVRWWKSANNPDRRKRPLEGDIAARCHAELRGIRALPQIISRRSEGRFSEPVRKAPRVTAEAAAQIIAAAKLGKPRTPEDDKRIERWEKIAARCSEA